MPYVNVCNFCGHLVADPTLETDKGERVKFKIALNKPGAPRAYYMDCVYWGAAAKFLSETLKRGDEIFLTGEIETSTFQDERGSWHRTSCLRVEKYSILGKAGGEPKRSLRPPV